MKSYFLRKEFELRIFISLGIVAIVAGLSFSVFKDSPALAVFLGSVLGLSGSASLTGGYLFAAGVMAAVSLLRMWAGSILSSERVMAFRVQIDSLHIEGPYRLVRNPIYLADLIAFCAFAMLLPWMGILLPVLIYVHYIRLIKYEETSIHPIFGNGYESYRKQTPRLLPNVPGIKRIPAVLREFYINKDGLRHNGIYVLFIPGFIVASFTGEFYHAILIGVPCVIDWAIVHTKLGMQNNGKTSESSAQDGVFGDILYANCWEDPQTDRRALSINRDDIVFSITSGGCNVLAFLIDDPKKVVALDINPHQNYLLELKIAAFRNLNYDDLLCFLGIDECPDRDELYGKVRQNLSAPARSYWDSQQMKIRTGVIHCGSYERYMRLLRSLLILLIGRRSIESILQTGDAEERRHIFNTQFENLRWRIFTKVMLSRSVMTLLFDKAFFQYLEDAFSFGVHFAGKTKRALTVLPVSGNPYVHYILTGGYRKGSGIPLYLRPEHFAIIRSRLERIEIVTGSCEEYFKSLPSHSISKFNFSNIFEWMPAHQFESLLNITAQIGADGAVIVYRNLLVHREHPQALHSTIISRKKEARILLDDDLSFIYNNYVVEEIRKEAGVCHTKFVASKTAAQ